ncbi:MAG TPA: RNA polymerase sigma factor [Flavitalea sp.]|nr:RNA polymerase sigma factor [Flavitalea sp.]
MSLEDFNSRILPVKSKMFRFALKFMKSKEEAEDVIQEVLIKIWKQQNRLGELLNFEAWCMKLVKNQSLDRLKSVHYRNQAASISPELPSENKNPYQHAEMGNSIQRVHQLINSLPEKQKEIIHLRDVEGYAYQEIADIMDIDLNMVKVYLFRARNTIKAKLINAEAYGNR